MQSARKFDTEWCELDNLKVDIVEPSHLEYQAEGLKVRHVLAISSVILFLFVAPLVGILTRSWWSASAVVALAVFITSLAAVLVPSKVHQLET